MGWRRVSDDWLTAPEAARELGIALPSLYAYVSRGLVESHPTPGAGRGRRYRRTDVERLRSRAARRKPAGHEGFAVVIDTRLTLLEPSGHVYYRGWDATHASRIASYERVAQWLWSGIDEGEPATWAAPGRSVEVIRDATSRLPDRITSVDRLRVAATVVASTDPMRGDRRPSAVVVTGRSLIAALVDSLPDHGPSIARKPPLRLPDAAARSDSIAARLWPKLSDRPPRRGELAVLNTALVLWADHELAASTLAARVAASTWADPYLVVQAGLATLGGPLHGAATDSTRSMFVEVVAGRPAYDAVGDRLGSVVGLPGVGHTVYDTVDPRATALLSAIENARPPARAWSSVQAVREVIRDRGLPPINVDFAGGAMCLCLGLTDGAGETIFAVARCAGWLAHAIEEYEHRLRFRPRAAYVGDPPRQ
jgi:citrate synthase